MHLLVGNSSKAKRNLGWEPKMGIKKLANIMIRNNWDLEVRNEHETRLGTPFIWFKYKFVNFFVLQNQFSRRKFLSCHYIC